MRTLWRLEKFCQFLSIFFNPNVLQAGQRWLFSGNLLAMFWKGYVVFWYNHLFTRLYCNFSAAELWSERGLYAALLSQWTAYALQNVDSQDATRQRLCSVFVRPTEEISPSWKYVKHIDSQIILFNYCSHDKLVAVILVLLVFFYAIVHNADLTCDHRICNFWIGGPLRVYGVAEQFFKSFASLLNALFTETYAETKIYCMEGNSRIFRAAPHSPEFSVYA